MDYERIQQLERPEYELIDADKWDRTSFTEQLEAVEDLSELLEEGLGKLMTFWGIEQDLFTIFFSPDAEMKLNPNPLLVVNAQVLNVVWKLEETERLKIHTVYRRTAATDAIIRLGKAILEAIPPEAAEMQKQLLEQGQKRREEDEQGRSPTGDEDDPGDGAEGSRGDPDGRSDEQPDDGSGDGAGSSDRGDQDGDGDQPGGGDGSGRGSGGEGSAPGQDGQSGQDGGDPGSGGSGGGGGGQAGQGGSVPPGRGSGGDQGQPGSQGSGSGGQGRGGTPGDGDGAPESDRGRGPGGKGRSRPQNRPGHGKDQSPGGPDGQGPGQGGRDRGPDQPARGKAQGPGDAAVEALRQKLDLALKQAGPGIKDAIAKATGAAAADAKELSDLKSSQGWSLDKDLPGCKDPAEAFMMMKKLKDDPRLLEMMRRFGNKLRTLALAKRDQKPVGEGFTVVGRTIGDDLTRVPMDEAWRITNPKFRIFTAIDLAQGSLPQDEHKEIHEGQKGDMILLMDISSSTLGDVHKWICMMALAMQSVAQRENRRFLAVPFNESAWPEFDLTQPNLETLMRFAALSPRGGTQIESALDKGIALLKVSDSKRPPDLIVLTDGQCPFFRATDGYIKDLESLNSRLFVIYVGVSEESERRYPELGQIAGPENKILLKNIFDWEGIGQVFENL